MLNTVHASGRLYKDMSLKSVAQRPRTFSVRCHMFGCTKCVLATGKGYSDIKQQRSLQEARKVSKLLLRLHPLLQIGCRKLLAKLAKQCGPQSNIIVGPRHHAWPWVIWSTDYTIRETCNLSSSFQMNIANICASLTSRLLYRHVF